MDTTCRLFRFLLFVIYFTLSLLTNLYAEKSPAPHRQTTPDPTGNIRVMVDVENVRVYFNGEVEGLAHPDRPLIRHYLPVGQITVTVRAKGLPELSQSAAILPDQWSEVAFALRSQSPHVRKLVAQGDRYFKNRHLMAPKGRNAFESYQKVLAADPSNRHAREKIRAIMAHHREQGDRAYARKDYPLARTAYGHYIRVARYALRTFGDAATQTEIHETEQRLTVLNLLGRPPDQLLEDGDRYFRLQCYVTPGGKNAFEMYKAVLVLDPANDHARQKIREMVRIYKALGEKVRQRSFDRAKSYYKNYLTILQYLRDQQSDKSAEAELKRVRREIRALETGTQTAEEWVKKGDLYFIAQKFAGSDDRNAVTCYRAALDRDPTNSDARRRLRQIMDRYIRWGQQADEAGDHIRAGKFYRHYLRIATYLSEVLKKVRPTAEARRVEERVILLESVEALIREGEARREACRQNLPSEENPAFVAYRKALALHPRNIYVPEKIREIMADYAERTSDAEAAGRYVEATIFLRKYRSVAKYALNLMADPAIKQKLQEAEARLDTLKTLICTETLTEVRQRLELHLGTYGKLRQREDQEANVVGQVVPMLQEIIADLNELERLYDQFFKDNPDIREKTAYLQQTRKALEREMAARSGKAF